MGIRRERKNRSVVEAARAMLEEKSLPKFYWAEAVRTAVYIQNRIVDKVSAHELNFGTKPNLRHLRRKGGSWTRRPRNASWLDTQTRRRVISAITLAPNKRALEAVETRPCIPRVRS